MGHGVGSVGYGMRAVMNPMGVVERSQGRKGTLTDGVSRRIPNVIWTADAVVVGRVRQV